MDRRETLEKVLELMFGLVAIVAAIGEAIANGITLSSVFGAIKDISSTLIIIALFILFIRQIPRKPKNLVELLEREVENWGKDNSPLIFKAEGYVSAKDSPYTQGFLLLQNPRSFASLSSMDPDSPEWENYAKYGSGNRLTGKFIDMPEYKQMTEDTVQVQFIMEQAHFSNMVEINEIVDSIISAINQRYKNLVGAHRIGASYKFTLQYKKIETEDDVRTFVDILDYVLSLVKVVA